MRKYHYIGSKEIRDSVANYSIGTKIKSQQDIKNWINDSGQEIDSHGFIICTFIIDIEGNLLIADRHSEHVACSGGNYVLSAGEIFFSFDNNEYKIIEISNQSTGFCPEPESWSSVSKALDKIPIERPNKFTTDFIFRRCIKCNLLNIVKEDLFFVLLVMQNYLKYGTAMLIIKVYLTIPILFWH